MPSMIQPINEPTIRVSLNVLVRERQSSSWRGESCDPPAIPPMAARRTRTTHLCEVLSLLPIRLLVLRVRPGLLPLGRRVVALPVLGTPLIARFVGAGEYRDR